MVQNPLIFFLPRPHTIHSYHTRQRHPRASHFINTNTPNSFCLSSRSPSLSICYCVGLESIWLLIDKAPHWTHGYIPLIFLSCCMSHTHSLSQCSVFVFFEFFPLPSTTAHYPPSPSTITHHPSHTAHQPLPTTHHPLFPHNFSHHSLPLPPPISLCLHLPDHHPYLSITITTTSIRHHFTAITTTGVGHHLSPPPPQGITIYFSKRKNINILLFFFC